MTAKKELAWQSGLEDSLAYLHGLLVVMPEEVIGFIGLDRLTPIHPKIKHCRRHPYPPAVKQYDVPKGTSWSNVRVAKGMKKAPWYVGNNTRLRIRLSSSSDLLEFGQVLNCLTFNFLSHFGYSTWILLDNVDVRDLEM